MKFSLIILLVFASKILLFADTFDAIIAFKADSVLPPYILEWSEDNLMSLTVTNTAQHPITFKIGVSVVLNGNLAAKTFITTEKIRTLAPLATQVYQAKDIVAVKDLRFYDKHNTLDKWAGGLTKSGEYTICINITDTTGNNHIAKPFCSQHKIEAYKLPVLLTPQHGDSIKTNTIRFSWFPVMPKPRKVLYTVQCYPMYNLQTPAQAIRDYPAVLNHIVTDSTQFVFKIPDTLSSQNFVWNVVALRPDGIPYASSDGYSSIAMFTIQHPQLPIIKPKKKKK